ncbi:TonB-dependent receptor [Gluconacetobacter azotocaptans]|uniref:TonB-dependent receptor n=1 Tax=Gluconacetobacter azotocaptans TaxID=142834 RepID=UPI00195A6291|nr:TonB-dependent receptor [Gluconacetobacter azotocaptans]MBM9403329.1 TonB-dependent receptor [Gluconacetobacter azotocaptans]
MRSGRVIARNRRLLRARLLGSAVLGGVIGGVIGGEPAFAQTAPEPVSPSSHASAKHRPAAPRATPQGAAKTAGAPRAPVRRAGLTPTSDEAVNVVASHHVSHGGEVSVTRAMLESQVAGTNILKSVGQLPGVSFSSSDPLGLDTWGTSVYVRGFFQDSIGMTLDGIPLNDQTYSSVNGINVANAWISDDIQSVETSQGAGGVDLPGNSSLGGTMRFHTSDPKDKAGAKVSQVFASYGTMRTYVRADSGALNRTGTKFYAAYSRADERKYDAPTPGFMQSVNGKLVQPIGNDSRITSIFNWNDAEVWGYADKSLSILKNAGWRTESWAPNYLGAYNASEYAWVNDNGLAYTGPGSYDVGSGTPLVLPQGTSPTIPASWQNTNEGAGTAYYDAGQATQDYLGGINADLALTDRLRWNTVFYAAANDSHATYGDPWTQSIGTGAPLSEEVWQSSYQRFGFTSAFMWHIGRHNINVGGWYENNSQRADLFWYNEPIYGQGSPLKTVGPYTTYGPAFQQGYGFTWNTNAFQFHVMDTWRPVDSLAVTYGFRSMLQTSSGGAYYGNVDAGYGSDTGYGAVSGLPNGSMTSAAAFLPAVNLDWHFLRGHELYFDFAENMRPFMVAPSGGSVSPWAVSSQDAFRSLQHNLPNERDFSYVVGYRYTSRKLQASIDAYHSDVYNRLISASVGSLNNPLTSVVNSKHATMYGMDASLTLAPFNGLARGLAWTNSISYNHFTYADDVNICPLSGDCDIKGKKMLAYPQVMYKTSLSYEYKGASAHFDVNYYGKRYFSYMNDTSISPYWMANLGAKYRFGNLSVLKNVTASFEVYNLFNQKYVAMMGENGFPIGGQSGDGGDYQSLERGAVREFFGTISAEY